MSYSNRRRRYFGMTGAQVGIIGILALLTFGVVIGGGYYVLNDMGVLGGADEELVAQVPPTPTENPTDTPTPSSTPEATKGNVLPPAWTATPSPTEVPLDPSTWTLFIDDLTPDFEEIPMEELGFEKDGLLFGGEYPLPNIFAFILSDDVNDEFQTIYGWTLLIEDEVDQDDFDTEIQEMDLFSDDMREDLNAEEIIDQRELDTMNDVGDSSRAVTLVARIEDVDFRLDIVVFRRGAAGVFCATIYLDGDTPVVPIEDVAQILDARIQGQ